MALFLFAWLMVGLICALTFGRMCHLMNDTFILPQPHAHTQDIRLAA